MPTHRYFEEICNNTVPQRKQLDYHVGENLRNPNSSEKRVEKQNKTKKTLIEDWGSNRSKTVEGVSEQTHTELMENVLQYDNIQLPLRITACSTVVHLCSIIFSLNSMSYQLLLNTYLLYRNFH